MNLVTILLSALSLTLLPIGSESQWKSLQFDGTPANEVNFSDLGIEIEVKESASVLLYLFPEPKEVSEFSIRGEVNGNLNLAAETGWADAPDDALLRVGIIETGTRKLTPIEKIAAPRWVKNLESMLGDGDVGVGQIRCFNLQPNGDWVGKSRVNPNVSFFHETVAASPTPEGAFAWGSKLDAPAQAHGFWIIADGDNTSSSFTTTIEEFAVKFR